VSGLPGGRDFRLRGRRALTEWGVVAFLALLLVLFLNAGKVADRPDFAIYDALIQMDRKATDDQILIIAIDNRSLSELGRWPWPRTYHAQLLEQVRKAQPMAIGYDVLFLEEEDSDPELVQAIQQTGNVYLPALIDAPGPDGQPWIVHSPAGRLSEAAAGIGHVNLTVDSDGLVRRLPLFVHAGATTWPHLSLQLARHVQGSRGHEHPTTPPPVDSLAVTENEAISFRGGPGSYQTLSFVDVMRGEVPSTFLRGKLIFVGATAAGMGDRYATPLAPQGELMRGVEIQAALLQTILEDCAPHDLPDWAQILLSLLPTGILLAGFLFLRPLNNMVLGLCLMVLVLVLSAGLFVICKIWFAPTPALGGLIFAYPMWSWRRLVTASAYMQSELKTFEQAGLITHIPSLPLRDEMALAPRGDVVSRQVYALRTTLNSLRAFERFTHEGLRSLPDATIIVDNDGTILLANQKAEEVFGNIVQPSGTLEHLFSSLNWPSWREVFVAQTPTDIIMPDGLVLQPAVSRLTDNEDRDSGFILRLADMTQIRAAERQRDNVVQLLTHDLRAPQASILTLLASDPQRNDPETNRRIETYARQTLDLAEGYVQLARAESQIVRSETLDLVQVAMDAADTLWPQALAKGVTLRTPDTDKEILFIGDPSLMRRMLVNLMDNALKYGPAGEDIDCEISRSHGVYGHLIHILVRDRGPGLTPKAVGRLFQPFGQGGTEKVGVGLGLAFVRTVAERHGGSVTYQPMNPGAGFVVSLPAPDPSAPL